jgi:LEA14-like dessication related protein
MKTLLACAIVALVGIGCQTAPPVPEQKVAVAAAPVPYAPFVLNDVTAEGESLVGLSLKVAGKVARNVSERELTWTAKAGEKSLGSGTATLEPGADGTFLVALPVKLGETAEDLAPFQGSDAIELTVDASLPGGLTATRSRAIRTPRLPVLAMLTVEATKTSTATVALTYTISVRNPNLFEVKLSGLKYKGELNGKVLGEGSLPGGGRIPSASETTFELPVEANAQNCGKDIHSIVRKSQMPWAFTGTMRFGDIEVPFDLNGEVKLSQ